MALTMVVRQPHSRIRAKSKEEQGKNEDDVEQTRGKLRGEGDGEYKGASGHKKRAQKPVL